MHIKMKCEEFENAIIDYLENKLDSGFKKDFEKHIETCEKCLDELRDFQRILRVISEEKMEIPDDTMRINFYHMLHSEIKKNETKQVPPVIMKRESWYNRSFYRVAAGIALLICGLVTGMLIYSGIVASSQKLELARLQGEVTNLRKTAMFTMLDKESSSERIMAVSYADAMDVPDQSVIDALVNTLNNDKNVNVRLAAAYALARYSNQDTVRDSLVQSLPLQNDPILQITLINILVDSKETRALGPIEKIINDESTNEEVKKIAKDRAKLLI